MILSLSNASGGAGNPAASFPVSESSQSIDAPRVSAGVTALRCALQAYLHARSPESALRRALWLFGEQIRRTGLGPEQLLVRVKAAWFSLPELHALPPATRRILLDRLITTSVEEFYADAR